MARFVLGQSLPSVLRLCLFLFNLWPGFFLVSRCLPFYGQICTLLIAGIRYMGRCVLLRNCVKGNPDSFHNHVQKLADNIIKLNLLR